MKFKTLDDERAWPDARGEVEKAKITKATEIPRERTDRNTPRQRIRRYADGAPEPKEGAAKKHTQIMRMGNMLHVTQKKMRKKGRKKALR